MATDDAHDSESAATSTKRDDGPPTTIDERAPDTRVDPERVDAIAGLRAISHTIKMSDADPIVDPAPPTDASRPSSPSEEVITLKKGQNKAGEEPGSRASDPPAPSTERRKKRRKSKIEDTHPDPPNPSAPSGRVAAAPPPISDPDPAPAAPPSPAPATPGASKAGKRAIRETLPDPDAHPLEPTVDDRIVAPRAKPAKQKKSAAPPRPSPLANPLVWVVGAIMLAALVAFGIFLSSSGDPPAKKTEKSARTSATVNRPLPQPANTVPPSTPSPQPANPSDTPVPSPTPDPTPTTTSPKPTPTPRSSTTPTPHPTPTPGGSISPFPTFVIPTTIPSFPGMTGNPATGSGP
jgi:hypothetical protein